MPSGHEPLPISPELLDQWALGRLLPAEQAELQARIDADPALAAVAAQSQRDVRAMRAALAAGHVAAGGDIADEMLASYLDDALDAEARAQIEQCAARSPRLLARLAALRREVRAVMDPLDEIKVTEKFLAGETLPFDPALGQTSGSHETTYDSIVEADEARKRRYLQPGN